VVSSYLVAINAKKYKNKKRTVRRLSGHSIKPPPPIHHHEK
jgi:hypothetical protein